MGLERRGRSGRRRRGGSWGGETAGGLILLLLSSVDFSVIRPLVFYPKVPKMALVLTSASSCRNG
jgi:hypothetical protein